MYYQPMPIPVHFPRLAERRLAEALANSPVVLVQGPRQCGKSTLAQITCASCSPTPAEGRIAWGSGQLTSESTRQNRDYGYFSLDDPVTRDGARADPTGFVAALPERVILAEVQHVPELFSVIKMAVDRQRTPGRFLLTGSSNVFRLPRLSDSPAGRMRIVPLCPLSQCEIERRYEPGRWPAQTSHRDAGFLNALFGDGFPMFQSECLGAQLAERIVAGGYPAALAQPTARHRTNWYRDYVETLVQRDVRDISRVRSLDVLPLLLRVAASQTARLFNLSSLAGSFERSRPTIEHYVTLLERLYLLERLPAWRSTRPKRQITSPKLHLTDTGLAAALLGVDAAALAADRALAGRLLETFVLQELRRQASWRNPPTDMFHFRDKDGAEVDIVIEQPSGALAGVTVKAAATVNSADFRGLRKLKTLACDRFVRGVVLYDGELSLPFGERLHAVPIARLWNSLRSV